MEHQLRVMEHTFAQLQDKYTTDVTRLEREVKFHKEKHESLARELAAMNKTTQLLPSAEHCLQQLKEEQGRRSKVEGDLEEMVGRYKTLVRQKMDVDREKDRLASAHNTEKSTWEDERLQLTGVIDQLRSTNLDLTQRLEDKHADRTIRLITNERNELQEKCRVLAKELTSLRDENARAQWDVDSSTATSQQRVQELTLRVRVAESDANRAKERAQRMQMDTNDLQLQIDKLQSEKVHLEKSVSALRMETSQKDSELSAERGKVKKLVAEQMHQIEIERMQWQAKLGDVQRRLEDVQRQHQNALEQITDVQAAGNAKVQAARDESQSLVATLERTVSELRANADQASLRTKIEVDRLVEENRALSSDLKSCRSTSEALQQEMHDIRLRFDRSESERIWNANERERLNQENLTLSSRVRELEHRAVLVDTKQHEIDSLRVEIRSLNQRLKIIPTTATTSSSKDGRQRSSLKPSSGNVTSYPPVTTGAQRYVHQPPRDVIQSSYDILAQLSSELQC
eukprot:PhM_4_TR13171/c0_g1_i1/m.7519